LHDATNIGCSATDGDANAHRRRAGKPPKKWVPEPLTLDRRREALRLHGDTHVQLITKAVTRIRQIVDELDATMNSSLDNYRYRILVKSLESIRAQCEHLQIVSLGDLRQCHRWEFGARHPLACAAAPPMQAMVLTRAATVIARDRRMRSGCRSDGEEFISRDCCA